MNNNLFQSHILSDTPVFTDTTIQSETVDLKTQRQLAQDMLKGFILPLTYDGSEAIHSAMQQFITQSLHHITVLSCTYRDLFAVSCMSIQDVLQDHFAVKPKLSKL